MEPAVAPDDGPTTAPPQANVEILPLLVQAVVDYAIFALDADGRVATWNDGAERLKGYDAAEILGTHFSRFYTEEDRAEGLPQAGLAQARERGRWESQGWRVRKDGSRFWADVVITALRAGDGTLVGFAKVTRDLSERKRNEDALREGLERERAAVARLQALNETKDELVAVIAHDLREPIVVIRHFLDLLRDDWDSSSEAEKVDAIRRLGARATSLGVLVEDVLDLAHIEAGHLRVDPVPIDLAPTIERVAADLSATAPARTVTVATENVRILADPQRTWQVLVNLVSNARKFSPPDSPVEIATERVGDEVVVSVTDHGSGIPPDQQQLLFQRFTRLSNSTGVPGSGIGLSIARSLIEAQGGRIWVDSTAEDGSTFRFALPVAP